MIPVRSDINQVDILSLAHVNVSRLSAVYVSRRKSDFAQILLGIPCTLFLIITKSDNLYAGDVAIALHSPRAATAKTRESHPDGLQLGSGKPKS
jgi:hypothetical protein